VPPRGSIGERINQWVQIGALLLGGVWAIYTFVYKELVLPASSPPHINTSISFARAGAAHQNSPHGVLAIDAKFKIRNESKRSISVLPSYFAVWGKKLTDDCDAQDSFATNANEVLASGGLLAVRHCALGSARLVAVGSPFRDWTLAPHETSTENVLFHVPSGEYDYLEVSLHVLYAVEQPNFNIVWRMEEQSIATPNFLSLSGESLSANDLLVQKEWVRAQVSRAKSTAMLSLFSEE
jgi:hypothetical protein